MAFGSEDMAFGTEPRSFSVVKRLELSGDSKYAPHAQLLRTFDGTMEPFARLVVPVGLALKGSQREAISFFFGGSTSYFETPRPSTSGKAGSVGRL